MVITNVRITHIILQLECGLTKLYRIDNLPNNICI